MKALHFGAGNIGRGFIGKLLAEAGYEVVFADVVEDLIKELDERREFKVRIVGESGERWETTKISHAVLSNTDAIFPEILSADLLTTAVGPRILERIAPTLAKGIAARRAAGVETPLVIIACENAIRATSVLKSHVVNAMDADTKEWAAGHVAFVDCAVDRIVPPARHEDKLQVTVEDFCEWVIDETQLLKGESVGRIQNPNVIYTDRLDAFVERKLMTVNTGHAICAYLGRLMGHPDIRSSISDPVIAETVKGAMSESGAVLVQRYGLDPAEHARYIDKIINRFKNPHIKDDVSRVGREPMRKLANGDRLIKPLQGCLEFGLPHEHLTVGIAAALLYTDPQDSQAVELQALMRDKGQEHVLVQVCGMDNKTQNAAFSKINSAFNSLNQKYKVSI